MRNKKVSVLLPYIMLACGTCFLAAGIWREEVTMIFMKAVNVCFQCIGIG